MLDSSCKLGQKTTPNVSCTGTSRHSALLRGRGGRRKGGGLRAGIPGLCASAAALLRGRAGRSKGGGLCASAAALLGGRGGRVSRGYVPLLPSCCVVREGAVRAGGCGWASGGCVPLLVVRRSVPGSATDVLPIK